MYSPALQQPKITPIKELQLDDDSPPKQKDNRRQTIGLQPRPELHEMNSLLVAEDDLKETIKMNHDIIEDMENVLNEFMTLKLFGVVECKCSKPKHLQFIATMDEDNTMECQNCHKLYSSIFKCDACGMSICSKCQQYIAEMQCLRSVMQHFKYPKDIQLKEVNEYYQDGDDEMDAFLN